MTGTRAVIPPIERIARRCTYQDGGYQTPCRIYHGYASVVGYPIIAVGSTTDGSRRNVQLHRLVYEHHHGQIPAGMVIDHLCRQKNCCEITHIELVTPRENVIRGNTSRVTRERHAARTHCKHGHEFTAENTRWVDDEGYRCRVCRSCSRANKRKQRHAR